MPLVNVALLASGATATAYDNPAFVPANNTIDGNDGTYWQPNGSDAYGRWVRIDLGQPQVIEQIRYRNYQNQNLLPASILIEASDDDSSWFTVKNYAPTGLDETFSVNISYARYWRFTCTAHTASGWAVQTIELRSSGGQPVGEIACSSTPTDVMQFIWYNLYQEVFSSLSSLFPQWSFAPETAFQMAFLVYIARRTHCLEEAMGGGGGDHIPSNQEIYDALAAHDTNLNTRMDSASTVRTTIATDATADRLAKKVEIVDAVNAAALGVEQAADLDRVSLEGSILDAQGVLVTLVNQNTSAIATNDNANKTAILNDAATKAAALTATITSGLAQQTMDLTGPLWTTHDEIFNAVTALNPRLTDIENAIGALPSNSGLPLPWPGLGGVTLGDPITITGPMEWEDECDGVMVSVLAFPPGQSRQPAADVTRYKGLGWLAFRSDLDDHEDLQGISLSHQVIVPKVIAHPTGFAVYCKPGTTLSVTPFLISAV
ncbi:MAG TPA: discoidin domain-containing protein [Verrucomicrobiae bacterium]